MTELAQQTCEVCRIGAPQVTPEEINEYMPQIPRWKIIEVEGVSRLQRVFEFGDFKQALAFTNKVGELAEAHDHHPAILTEWGKVTVTWWTHKIHGLHINDFVMAAKSDELL